MSSSSSVSINNLAAESLAHIFALLPLDERVRLERVCQKWQKVARKYAWTEFRTLELNSQELKQQGDLAVAKYRALLDRCSPYLRWLSTSIVGYNVEQWAKMRNLRYLRFDMCVSTGTLRAIAENLKHLQHIHFSDIDWRSVSRLHDLLRINNASLHALHLPPCNSRGDSLCLSALPSSLRSLHISDGASYSNANNDYIDELLELAATCCPQLAFLILPMNLNELSLSKLVRFENLFYLRLSFHPSHVNLFGNSLAKIGPQLRALLLGPVGSKTLQLIAQHCPLLEHCSFHIIYGFPSEAEGALSSALHSVFQLAHLRSVSICYACTSDLSAQIMDAINGLNAKGTLEYLHLSGGSPPLPIEFVTNLIQLNPKLHKLACAIRNTHTSAELGELKMLLQNMEGPLELELYGQNLSELGLGENGRVRMRRDHLPEISQPIVNQFWARVLYSVP